MIPQVICTDKTYVLYDDEGQTELSCYEDEGIWCMSYKRTPNISEFKN